MSIGNAKYKMQNEGLSVRRIITLGIACGVIFLLAVVGFTFWWQNEPSTPLTPAAESSSVLSYFQDRTIESGVDFTYQNGEEANQYAILESVGGGVALFDFDGDGLLDLFVTGGGYFSGEDKRDIRGRPCRLYKNLGNWKFRDVTAEVGLGHEWFYSHGCAVADYDCDGWPDLLVTGYRHIALFHNEPVDPNDPSKGRRFRDVTAQSRLDGGLWPTSAAWADLDGDGYPDLYVCSYLDWSWKNHKTCDGDHVIVERELCPPETFAGIPHRLFHNNRDGTFTDVSQEAGLRPECGKGLGVLLLDVDGDRRPDIYAVNDGVRNFLYRNESSPGKLRFTECAISAGVAMGDRGKPDGSMGVDAADYDGSGRPSLLVTTFEGEFPAFYRNESSPERPLFHYATEPAGLAVLGNKFVGFGAAFLDLDLDGWEDVVMVNGHVRRFPTSCGLRQRALLFRNQGNGSFADISYEGGSYFNVLHRGRGLAVGDLDNDGRPDLVISHLNNQLALLQNAPEGVGLPQHHWLGIELQGKRHRDIAGAKVVLKVGDRLLTRFARGGGSYLSAPDRRLLFGLAGTTAVDRVTVVWPWGEEQHWDGLAIDRYWQLREGEANAARPPNRP
jgi:hypothetical protein